AIMTYLEQTQPEPALWPSDPVTRARAVELAELANSAIQPMQNSATLAHLQELGVDRKAWGAHYNLQGLAAMEAMAVELKSSLPDATFLTGPRLSVADLCLVPQLYSARRFDVDTASFPRLLEVEAACETHAAFIDAHPDRQPDAPPPQ
ncbi:MAG: maleylacetoacetate isomerase, partial [Myxococcota bacterium]